MLPEVFVNVSSGIRGCVADVSPTMIHSPNSDAKVRHAMRFSPASRSFVTLLPRTHHHHQAHSSFTCFITTSYPFSPQIQNTSNHNCPQLFPFSLHSLPTHNSPPSLPPIAPSLLLAFPQTTSPKYPFAIASKTPICLKLQKLFLIVSIIHNNGDFRFTSNHPQYIIYMWKRHCNWLIVHIRSSSKVHLGTSSQPSLPPWRQPFNQSTGFSEFRIFRGDIFEETCTHKNTKNDKM